MRGEVPFVGRRSALLAAGCLALLGLLPAGSAAAASGPELSVPQSKLEASLRCPETFEKPGEPVLLVHGTWANADVNWGWGYVKGLEIVGLDACLVDLPNYSTGDIQESAEYVVHAIREIHRRSGEKVDVIGHSQGGLQPRWAIKWWPDVQDAVDDYVGLASPNHGTAVADVPAKGSGCMPSCMQMAPSSQFLAALNRDDETPGAASYTNLYSLTDELVQPAAPEATSALDGGVNVLMQEMCPGRPVEHLQFAADGAVFDIVLDALTHPGGFDPSRFDMVASCAKGEFEGSSIAELAEYSDSYEFPFTETFQSGQEPPLKPYARAEGSGESGDGVLHGDPGPEVDGIATASGGGATDGAGPAVSGRPTPATGAPLTLLGSAGAALAGLGWLGRRTGIRAR